MRERNWSGTWTDWAYFRAYRLKKKNRRVTGMSQQLVCNDGAGGGGRTLMPSEGRGILSPVRLPVPPLQQVVGSFEVTTHSRFPYCNGFGIHRSHYLTLFSVTARSTLRSAKYFSSFSEAPEISNRRRV